MAQKYQWNLTDGSEEHHPEPRAVSANLHNPKELAVQHMEVTSDQYLALFCSVEKRAICISPSYLAQKYD